MKHRFWYSDKQRRVSDWAGQMFNFNPSGLTSYPSLVLTIQGETIEMEYTEWTTGPNGCNWDDAILIAEMDEEPRVTVKWREYSRKESEIEP